MFGLEQTTKYLKRLQIEDFIIQNDQSPIITYWKVTNKVIRKSDNRIFSGVVIPDPKYFEACIEFIDRIEPYDHHSFLKPFGYLLPEPEKDETFSSPLIVFEEFKCTLGQYTVHNELSRSEFEELLRSMIDGIKFLTREVGQIFPRFTPDVIAVIKHRSGKHIFKIIDMYSIAKKPEVFPFEESKWFAPEVFTACLNTSRGFMLDPNDNGKALLFSAGLVFCYVNSRSNFHEKRKNAKTYEDLKKIWPQETSILDLALEKIKIRFSYNREDQSLSILRGMIQYDENQRIDIEKIREFGLSEQMGNIQGDTHLSFNSMDYKTPDKQDHPDDLYQKDIFGDSNHVNKNLSDHYQSVMLKMTNFEDDQYLFAGGRFDECEPSTGYYKTYKDHQTQQTFSGINYHIGMGTSPKDDQFIRQLKSIEKFEHEHILKFKGYFYVDESTLEDLVILFESHKGTLDERIAKSPLTREELFNLVDTVIDVLYSINTQSQYLPVYMTPRNIVLVPSSDKITAFKVILYKFQQYPPQGDNIWASPELFNSETIKDRAQSLVYSVALIFLYSINSKVPTSFRPDVISRDERKSREVEEINKAMTLFKNAVGLGKKAPQTGDAELEILMGRSIEQNPFHRADLTAWNIERGSFNMKVQEEKSKSGNISEAGKKYMITNTNQPSAPKKKSIFACCSSGKQKK